MGWYVCIIGIPNNHCPVCICSIAIAVAVVIAITAIYWAIKQMCNDCCTEGNDSTNMVTILAVLLNVMTSGVELLSGPRLFPCGIESNSTVLLKLSWRGVAASPGGWVVQDSRVLLPCGNAALPGTGRPFQEEDVKGCQWWWLLLWGIEHNILLPIPLSQQRQHGGGHQPPLVGG